MDTSLHCMSAADNEDRPTKHQKLASEGGFTGVSILNRLRQLYNFDVIKDMVFDTMHTLILRIVLRHLHFYQEQGMLRDTLID